MELFVRTKNMKIISFLGFNNYQETTYVHPSDSGKQSTTPFFQEALIDFFDQDILYIFLTKTVETKLPRGATQSNWEALQDRLKNSKVKLEAVYNVPEGNSPEDSWLIFDKITECLNHGDKVVLDLTHSFRSIPVIALLAISYLRTVRQVTVEGLVYGAFNPNVQGQPTQTYDLLPMLGLLDWIAATDRFVKVGDGVPLAELLKNAIPGTERQHNPAVRPLGSQLDLASKIIGEISQAIALVRPLETLELTVRLEEILNRADDGFDQRAKPFTLIAGQLLEEYGQFALSDSLDSESLSRNLWLQFQMIDWYMKRGQVMQAMTLAGEWLISVVAYRLGSNHLLDSRKQVGFALNNGSAILQKKQPQKSSEFDQAFQALPDYEELSDLRGILSEIRNDLAHVGMNKNPKSAKKLVDLANQIFPRLQSLAENLLISDDSPSVGELPQTI